MRYLKDDIVKDLSKKAILLTGPRQVGKSTLAKSIMTDNSVYLNWDIAKDRSVIKNISWDKSAEIVILNELHKMNKWKNYLKGVIDQYNNNPKLVVTGSARLDIFRKAGDALTGRQYLYKLHPIDLAESKTLAKELSINDRFDRLFKSGGMPESFFNPRDAERLRNDRFDLIIREDVRDLSRINAITTFQSLVDILRDRGPGQLSFNSLAEDLSISSPTVKEWIGLLEKLFLIFIVRPYHSSLSRSLKKETKFYFYDCGATFDERKKGEIFENMVACSLLKFCDYQHNVNGKKFELKYFRDKEKREVDFVVTLNTKPYYIIECKYSDTTPSSSLLYLHRRLNPKMSIQLVKEMERSYETKDGIKIVPALKWLENLQNLVSNTTEIR